MKPSLDAFTVSYELVENNNKVIWNTCCLQAPCTCLGSFFERPIFTNPRIDGLLIT
jgi:hypothetical protein